MTVFNDISAALDGQLYELPDMPPVAWENRSFTPVMGTLYLRPTLIPGDVSQATLGDSGTDMHVGLYQIDVFAEAGRGKRSAIEMADQLADHFKRGTVITYNSRTIRIQNASRQAGINNADGWYQIPVIISYSAYTAARD